jgi:signal transduction histidine kinase
MQKYFHIVVSSHLDSTKEKIILITLDDVTENVKLIREAEKNESLRMLGMFTTGIAHEIRNPLTSVKGFVQLLGKKVQAIDGAPRMVHLVIREIDRLESLLKDLITYARPSKTNFEWVQVSELVSIIEKLLVEKIKQRKLIWKVENLENIEICADSRKVHQVIFNLVLNAIQSVKIDQGEVTIYGTFEEKYLWICVKDNGYGIASEDFGKIFTPFFTTKDKGTGLGLIITKEFIHLNRGSLGVDSIKDEGTTFIIKLPAYKESNP